MVFGDPPATGSSGLVLLSEGQLFSLSGVNFQIIRQALRRPSLYGLAVN